MIKTYLETATDSLSGKIVNIIREARNELFLITPYIKLNKWKRIKKSLKFAKKIGLKITFILREPASDYKMKRVLTQLKAVRGKNCKLYFIENLHAKIYYNRKEALITSMNLHQHSAYNNHEVGIIIAKSDKQDLIKLKTYIDFLINEANLYYKNGKISKVKKSEKSSFFRDAYLPQHEVKILKELETQVAKQFHLVEEISDKSTMGFSVKDNRVRGLGLYKCNISNFPEAITRFTSLEKLSLMGNNLSKIPETIGRLTSLEILILRYNQIEALPKKIGDLISLRKLYLKNNKLTSLPKSIGNLTNLKRLILNDNEINRLPQTIVNLNLLKILNLRWNQISTLPETIGNLKNLRELNLIYNQLEILPDSMEYLDSLKILKIQNNNFKETPQLLRKLEERNVKIL